MNHPNDDKSIAECVMRAITRERMIHAADLTTNQFFENVAFVWSANAMERLEALISEEIGRRARNALQS